jgi:hypothetical protein
VKTLRSWHRICLANKSSLRRVSLCVNETGFWVGFTEVSPEGPDLIIYLPLTHILPMADALDTVAERNDHKYVFIPCPIEGKDYWGKPARLNGAAYAMASFRYRPGILFNGQEGIWSVWFTSSRHARLFARLLRQIDRQHGMVPP